MGWIEQSKFSLKNEREWEREKDHTHLYWFSLS